MAYMKPDDQHVTSVRRQFGWTDLPESGNPNPAPELPILEGSAVWTMKSQALWFDLWNTPQSLCWGRDQLPSLERYLVLYQRMSAGHMAAAMMASMHQLESSLGLTPKAMMALRWRVVPDDQADARFRPEPEPKKVATARPASNRNIDW